MLFKTSSAALVLSLTALVNAETRPFAPKSPLEIRGGGLDAAMVEKAQTIVQLTQSVPFTLAPDKGAAAYNAPVTPLNAYLAKGMYSTLLAFGIMLYCTVFKGTSVNTAAAAASVPWLAYHLQGVLGGGFLSKEGYMFGLAFTALIFYSVVADTDFADTMVKIGAAFYLACGAGFALFPTKSGDLWGMTEKRDASGIAFAKATGFFMIGNGVYLQSLLNGVDSAQALGYAVIPHLLFCFSALFVTKEVSNLSMNAPAVLTWLLFHIATVVTTLVLKDEAPVMMD